MELIIISICIFILAFAVCGAISQSIGVGLIGAISLTYCFSTWWTDNIINSPRKKKIEAYNTILERQKEDELIMKLEKELGLKNKRIIIIDAE